MKMIHFEDLGDTRGGLVSFEQNKNIPFEIRRVYCIHNVKESVSRGFHSHNILEQVAICISGSCTIVLDDGLLKRSAVLSSPKMGLYIGKNIWREMHNFSSDCVLLILASELYDEGDYIRSYAQFLKEVEIKGRGT